MQRKNRCPLYGKFLQTCIICNADAITNTGSIIYCGGSDEEFISRYKNHQNLFNHQHPEQEFSKHIWQLQGKHIHFN